MKKIALFCVCMFLAVSAHAAQWQIMGTRPMGMGGAFVGVAKGASAQYWNPGGLVSHSDDNYSGFQLPVSVKAEATGDIAKNASKIADMASKLKKMHNLQSSGGNVSSEDMAAFVETVALLDNMSKDSSKGLLADINAGLDFKLSKIAFSVNNFTSIGFTPYIDVKNVGLGAYGSEGLAGVTAANGTVVVGYEAPTATIQAALETLGMANVQQLLGDSSLTSSGLANFLVQTAVDNGMSYEQIVNAANTMAEYAPEATNVIAAAASGQSYKSNKSNLYADAASMVEIAAGYAWDISKVEGLSIGGNLKMINGYTANYKYDFMRDGKIDDFKYEDDVKSSWQPAADIGFLWDLDKFFTKLPMSPKAGLVLRNINSPEFKYVDGHKYSYDRQARFGLAINPTNWWTVAADMDITENDTLVQGYKSRQFALGTELNIGHSVNYNLPLRFGLIKNIADNSSKLAYSVGAGLHLLHMHFDIAALASPDTTEFKGKDYPTNVGLSAAFSMMF